MEQKVNALELSPAKRREYYQRAHELFSDPATNRMYSCVELCKMAFNDQHFAIYYGDTYEMYVMNYFPEYFAVLSDLGRATVGKWGRALIQKWPDSEAGNQERCKALAEAIKRVDLLINAQ